MRHAVIIPTYGRIDLVKQCVNSLRKFEKDCKIIVVDDGSSPKEQKDIYDFCTELELDSCLKTDNSGFADSVNQGIQSILDWKPDVITLVNNDIIFTEHIFQNIEKAFALHAAVGIVGGLLLYPDGTVQHGGLHYSPGTNSFLDKYKRKSPLKFDTFRYQLAVTGALFSIKKEVIEKIGLLNETYFLACEDTEYCLRAWEAGYRVLFSPYIKAIHLEGATRGDSPNAKEKKGAHWHKKEIEAIKQFRLDLKKYMPTIMQKEIDKLNTPPKKLEVGSGYNPHPGYIHVDIRPGLPQLDKVCDFAKDILPFKAGEFSEVLANHVIEHISFRKLPHVIKEWVRVLEPGGKLVLRTPDLDFIVDRYTGPLGPTPEHPNDEGFIKQHLSDEITPAWWANIKLFSGQDYAANFHHVCFSFDMLANLLKRYGFRDVRRVKFDTEFSPGELQVEAIKG